MFKTKNPLNPTIFAQKFISIAYQYPTSFLKHSFHEPNRKREFLEVAISS